MRKHSFIFLAILCGSLVCNAATITIACIGDSITRGPRGDGQASYPSRLGTILGDGFEVRNFGKPGISLARYDTTKEYLQAITFKADIVVIMLGTNDAHKKNWKSREFFKKKLKSLIAEFRKANPKVRIYLCAPPPIFRSKWGHDGHQLAEEIVPLVKQIAFEQQCKTIDFYTLFLDKESMLKDGVHPTKPGYRLMAETAAGILDSE